MNFILPVSLISSLFSLSAFANPIQFKCGDISGKAVTFDFDESEASAKISFFQEGVAPIIKSYKPPISHFNGNGSLKIKNLASGDILVKGHYNEIYRRETVEAFTVEFKNVQNKLFLNKYSSGSEIYTYNQPLKGVTETPVAWVEGLECSEF